MWRWKIYKHKDKSANETAKHQKQKLMDDTEVGALVTATKSGAHGVRTYTYTRSALGENIF